MDATSLRPPNEPAPHDTIAAALARLGHGSPDERVPLGTLIAGLEARAYGVVLLLLAAPNLTPGPSMPGFSTIFGLPLVLVAAQMMLGRPHPWLPAALARIAVRRGRLAGLIARATPLLLRIERVLKPRLPALGGPAAARGVGAACVALGVMLSLPIPIFSMLPAFAVLVIALGILAKDGLAVAAGLVAGAAALGTFAAVVWAALAFFGFV